MNRNWKETSLPDKMINLQVDKRGYPVPYVVLKDNKGEAVFQVNDTELWFKCVKENLCPICGQNLGLDRWLIGGPQSAFNPNGVYIDSPAHYDCSKYALQVCPYLAYTIYKGYMSEDKLSKLDTDCNLFVNPTVDVNRVPFFVLAHVKEVSLIVRSPTEHYLKPFRPFISYELWNDGKRIGELDAIKLLRE